jgi:membrane-bound lytic murein transglycosylase D
MEEPVSMMRSLRSGRWRAGLCLVAALLAGCASVAPLPLPPAAPEVTSPAPVSTPAPQTPPPIDLPVAASVAIAVAEAQNQDSGPATQPPVDPLRPDAPLVAPDEPVARIDLWQRVRGGFAMPELDGQLVRNWEQYYASRPEYVQRMTERGGRYLFHIMEEVDRRGLPSELALLPFIESAFNPEAMSRARASGMWQFMPATGRDFELTQNVFRDDRRDVLESTRAALDYLSSLNKMFGDWHLALAAYNWGQGNVQRAVRANERAGRDAGYVNLRMPIETRDYVPKLQAVKNIVADPQRFGLALPKLENHPYFLAVPISRDIDVDLAARLAGLSVADFRALNPQMNKPVILAAGTPQVLLPYDNANAFGAAVAQHRGRLATWTAWVAPKTMKTAEAARHAGMDESELRVVNDIPPRMLVKAGSTLLVPRAAHREADVSERIAENATLALSSEGPALRRVAIKVGKKGDSVGGVARRFGVRAEQVALWNKVAPGARFGAGATVVVYVPPRAAAKGSSRAAAKASSRASRPAAARKAARKR